MRTGISVEFDRLVELDERFEGVDFPVELDFPRSPEKFELLLGHLDAVAAFVQSRRLEVLSVHAPDGRISEPGALQWLLPLCRLAEDIEVKNVTVFPDECGNAAERESRREAFLRNYGVAAESFSGTISVGTISGGNRLFKPGELVETGLPIALDYPRLRSDGQAREIIRSRLPEIAGVYLSSWSEEEAFLPLDESSASTAILLKSLGFEGNLFLAYCPWHYYRAKDDLERLARIMESGEAEPFPPPDDKYRDDRAQWHFKGS